MGLPFYKYQGTGNDFVIIDNRNGIFPKNDTKHIALLCDRKFGIGADGLILLENDADTDFRMVYFNSDGAEGSMCGNGGRCITHFAKYLGIIDSTASFYAVDGLHRATITGDRIALQMQDVSEIQRSDDFIFIDTGSPHHVQLVEDLASFPVTSEGKRIRETRYGKEGANINFVMPEGPATFAVRTYERGVEAETLSCGTGVTAVALAMFASKITESKKVTLKTPGGLLEVHFDVTQGGFQHIELIGPAQMVYKGEWS